MHLHFAMHVLSLPKPQTTPKPNPLTLCILTNYYAPAAGDRTLEEMAAFKARQVFEATGLPTVSEATGFEVEAVDGGVGRRNARYRFNRLGDHVDKLVQFLSPVSDPDRVCTFRTVCCYFEGTKEIFTSFDVEVSMSYVDSVKAFITASAAILEMVEELQKMFNPEEKDLDDGEESVGKMQFMPQGMRTPITPQQRAASFQGAQLLKDSILKKGRVLPNGIIDVSTFMETMVDVPLMEECSKDLADRFALIRPNKILTVATTGLILAMPMAMLLQVELVYARKERSMVMSDYYIATYSSKTQGNNKQLVVNKNHLEPEDRVLIVDDFLSAGSCQDALLRIISDAGATPVGIAVLVEKAYEKGALFLSGYNLPIESLAKVLSVDEGRIELE
ncbi:unnamed protein product [Discosporangium mesarthrocarpum]